MVLGQDSLVVAEAWVGSVDLTSPLRSGPLLRFEGDAEGRMESDRRLASLIRRWQRRRRFLHWMGPLIRFWDRLIRRPYLSWFYMQLESIARR